MNETKTTAVVGGFSVVATTFLHQSIEEMIPWLLVMFAVIVCDLVVALRRCLILGEAVRISRAVRATMGKAVTYFSFVLMVCMLEVACQCNLHLDRWACLVVCAVEFASIISNLLKPKGLNVDYVETLSQVLKRMFGIKD